MSKLIRHAQKRGTALFLATGLLGLILLSLLTFIGGPQSRDGGTPAETQVSAPAQAQTDADQTDQAQTETAQPRITSTAHDLTAAEKSALRKSAHFGKKLYEPLASQVFSLQRSRVELQAAQRPSQGPESPNTEPTLTTDREDYPPYSYVYFHGAGFEPGETVQMIVAETDPVQQSFEPWEVVADANGEFDTSWYIFSQEFGGATFLATATGETSQLTASATFTDASGSGTMNVSPGSATPSSTGNSFTFSFRTEAGVSFPSSSAVSVVVPTGWTTPQTTTPGNPGYVSVVAVGSATVGSPSVTGTGPWTITVPVTSISAGTANGLDITYAGGGTKVTAPSTSGVYAFTAGSRSGGSGATTSLDTSPLIAVSTSSIFQRGSATTASVSTGTSLTINKPTGVVAGDVMIVNIEMEGGTTFPSLAGWTNVTTPTTFGSRRMALLYKVAGGSEPTSYAFTWTGSTEAEGAIVAFAGVDTSGSPPVPPFDVTPGSYTTGSGSTITGVTSISTVTANAAVLMFAATRNDSVLTSFTTATSPGALTQSYTTITQGIGGAWNFKAAAGSTGAGSAAISKNRDWAAILLALRPAQGCTCTVTLSNPSNATIECPASPTFTAPTASDSCGFGTTVNSLGDTTTAGTCANKYTAARSWNAVDACGNTSATVTQTITVTDTTAPTIGSAGSNATIQCPATPSFTAPTASDACGTSTVVQDSDTTATGTCNGTYSETKTWHAVDACGNTSVSRTQTITVADTTAPTIGSPGANNTVQCPALPSFTAPTASDTCSGATVQNLGDTTTAGTCANNFTVARSWRAVDGCGNTSGTVTQTSTVRDTTPPVIDAAGSNATIQCPATPSFTAPTASDACGTSTVVQDSDTTAAGTCTGTYSETKTWHAVDACGNTSASRNQTITVVDTTPPTISGQGANATIECPATPSFTAPTASDTCNGATVQDLGATTTAGTCANNYTSTKSWKAVDGCGNTSGTVTQTITVHDTTAPDISAAGADATIECPTTPSFTAPTASDACGGSTVNFLGETTTAGTCANNYTAARSWNAVDACGNTSATRTQTITVQDTTAPTISGQGSDATIECPASPSFTAPTASDACGGSTVQDLGATTTAGTCANNYTSAKSWKAVDACGNTSGTVTQTITVRDTTAPEVGNAGSDATIECPATPSFTAPTASDACGGSTVNFLGETTTAGTCANNYIASQSWNAVDACGNTSVTRTQTITVRDTTAPAISAAGSDATIECPATPSFTAPTASDACGGSTVNFLGETTTAGTCANNYTAARSWNAVDACGNTSVTRTQTITVHDTTAPTISGQGSDATIECPALPSFTAPTASDACGGSTVNFLGETTTAGTCANNYTAARSWNAVDECGNTSVTRTQTITVHDTTAPEISAAGADATIECPTTPSFTAPTASDACGGSTVNFLGETTTAGTCANNYTAARSWNAMDACGNTSVTRTQTITVQDTTAPAISSAGSDATIECPATPRFTAPTASDACGGWTVNFLGETTTAGTCANNYTAARSWNAVDACGNTSVTRTQTITVHDTTAPEIGGQGSNATIECPATPSFTAPTASDACGTSTVIEDSDTTAAGTCANDYSRTKSWHAVDACGNTSAQVSQTITVHDTTAPTISAGGSDATIECPATPSFTAPTASDACGGSTVNFLGETTTAGTCANNYTAARSWNAVDECGNTSVTRTQTITVQDTTAPAISAAGSNATIECPATPSFTAPTASDACGTSTVVEDSDTTTAGTCANDYSRTKSWHAVDACGNTSVTRTQTINVVDTTSPTISAAGSDATIECPASPSFTAPTASDACGGSTVNFLGETTTAGTCANNYTAARSWNAVDECGNTSVTRTQTITVHDTTAPAISAAGSNATIECPASPSFTAPTASDACGGSTVNFLGETTTAGTCANNYTAARSWNAVDECGNTSVTRTQTITVHDTTAPAISAAGSDATIECPATPSFTAPTASDACGGSTVVEDSDTTAAGTCANDYSRTKTWHAVDACGNTSVTRTQTITVVDTTAPAISGQGSDATIECPATPSFTAPTASDACGGSTVQDLGETTTAGTCANNYTAARSWHAVDACGNTSGTVTQTITVRDTTAPEIGGHGSNATIECPATPSFTAPTASDACGTSSIVLDSDTTTAGTCANDYTASRSWHAVDACGNTSGTVTQTITVRDTAPPTISAAGSDATIECPASPSFTAPTASDACGGSTVNFLGETTTAGTCANNYTAARSWNAVDECGNTSVTRTQTITVHDTTAPAISAAGSDATIECPATPSFTAPTASDACGGSTVNFLGETTTAGTCANNYTASRSWNAVDECGNTSVTRTQTITVHDTTAPAISAAGSNATIECPASPSFTAPTASDACGGSTVNFLGETTTAGTCANNYTAARSWNAVDACGNTSVTRTQTITVRDTTAPTIGSPGANNTVECPASPSFTAPTVSDTCSGATVQNLGDTTSGNSCTLVTTRSWRAVDGCGNTSGTVTQSSTRVDTTNPEIGSPGADNTVECPASPSFTAPTVSDTCSGATVENLGDTTSGNSCTLVTTRSWRAVDGCGNTSGTVSQTSTRVDTTAPVIGGQGSNATIECPASPSFTAPTASDACGGSTVQDLGATTTAGTCANNYTSAKSWKAVDACGNTSGTVTQTITVRDTTAPTIGGQGSNATIECPATPSFTAPTASDACGGSTVQDLGATTTAGTCANNYTSAKSWKAVDACGNTSGTVTQTITVRDTTAPTIGSPGADNTVECPASPSFTAPTVSDTCSGATVQNLGDTTSGNACALVTTRSWRAVDGCGNTSGTVTQSSTRVDTTAPVIGAAGGDATIECPATPSFTAPTASDACGGSTVVMDSDTTAAGTCANNYSRTRTWHAVDACGNTSASRSQTITVVDNTPPTIGGQGGNATIECPATPSFTAPTASDACGGSTVVQDSDTTAAGTCANGYSRTKTWHAVDACDNTSGQVSQTVTVRDTTAPTIGAPGANTTIACNGTPVFTPPTASDACGTATVQQVSDSTTTSGTNTLYTRCWRAVDACNNTSATVCQTITRPLGPWHITGFYPPVDMVPIGVVNTVKGGSTVPLKFNVYDCFNVERTSVSDVVGQTCQVAEYGCSGGPEDPMGDLPNTGATVLRYDTTGHQFIQNWAVPKPPNRCYRVRMTTIDGSVIEALFKTK